MTQGERERLRSTFDQAAELYDRARPRYPPALFDDLAELAGIGPGSRVLEVGPGTGQATIPLAERGCQVVAVELGAHLAAADALRPGGWLATIATHHVAGGDESFFAEAQDCYIRWDPATPPEGVSLPPAASISSSSDELDRSRRFGPAEFRRYESDQPYTTDSYREVLLTYSGHRAMPPAAQNGLLDCISHLIDTRHGGRITKRYLTELRAAPTVDPGP